MILEDAEVEINLDAAGIDDVLADTKPKESGKAFSKLLPKTGSARREDMEEGSYEIESWL